MTATVDYDAFLAGKQQVAKPAGFLDVTAADVHPILKPHQRDAVVWAVQGGRRALFEAFGLGKTIQQLEICRLITARTGGRALIVCPLGVRQEFRRDAQLLGLTTAFARTDREADAASADIVLTNYESVREGKLDPQTFDVVSLDEAAILRGFGGTKTFREMMRRYEGSAAYRFVATATPSPNDFLELLAYAAFLDVMDVGQAKTIFFKRDSEHADRLTLLPHMEEAFWHWVASWALFLTKPSDLGYSDDGYALPPIDVVWHQVPSQAVATPDREGNGRLFADAAMGVQDAAREKRTSIELRVAQVLEIIRDARVTEGTRPEPASSPEPGIQGVPARVPADVLPPDAGQEARADAGGGAAADLRADGRAVPGIDGSPGRGVRDLRAATDQADGRPRPLDGNGPRAVVPEVQHGDRDAGGQPGATDARGRVHPQQFVVWCELNEEQRCLERALAAEGVSFSSLYGNQDPDDRELLLDDWRERRTEVFLSKPSMYGSGVNLQQCHRMLFVGVTYKFSETIQAVHRIYRFLQTRPVRIDLIYTDAETEIRKKLEAKWRRHDQLVATMTQLIRERGLAAEAIGSTLHRSTFDPAERREVVGEHFRAVLNDTVIETTGMPDDSVDLILTSVPFSTQYEYSPSFNDFGHNEDNAAFWAQMDFLIPELLRVLRPGRVAAIHVKDRIVPGGMTGLGFQTVYPFSDDCVTHFRRHGFAFLARRTIVTDVVRENNQTYRLGWTEQCKDGTRMGAGMPEYLLLFRKPPTDASNGYADTPVVKDKAEYSRSRWQVDAHGFWRSNGNRHLSPDDFAGLTHAEMFRLFRDHNLTEVYDHDDHVALGESLEARRVLPTTFMLLQPPSWHPDVWTDIARMRTLNMLQQRHGLTQHLCPLPFDICDRVIAQHTMPGETVFDPFAGIMTVPYCAVKAGRYGVGVELAPEYFRDGVAHLHGAETRDDSPTLFDLLPDPATAEEATT